MATRTEDHIVDIDEGWKRILDALGDASGEVTIGIQQTEGAKIADVRDEAGNVVPGNKGTTVIEKAVANEFGLGVPERSFLRSTFDEKAGEWEQAMRKELGEVVDGRQTLDRAFKRLALRAVGDVQTKITEGPFVPNHPETIRRKRSSRPLIDTGQLRQSIRALGSTKSGDKKTKIDVKIENGGGQS